MIGLLQLGPNATAAHGNFTAGVGQRQFDAFGAPVLARVRELPRREVRGLLFERPLCADRTAVVAIVIQRLGEIDRAPPIRQSSEEIVILGAAELLAIPARSQRFGAAE